MEKLVRINDTLKLTREQGFPKELDIDKHLNESFKFEDFEEKIFEFDKPLPRIYPLPPTRTFLVQEVEGKWIKWGHCLVIEQTIYSNGDRTKGKFKITKLFDKDFIKLATVNDTPEGKSFFD
jgi:hypothetical protein